MTKWGLSQECKAGSTFRNQQTCHCTNKPNKKTRMIVALGADKATLMLNINCKQTRNEKELPYLIICEKPIANIVPKGKDGMFSLIKQEQGKIVWSHQFCFLFNSILEILAIETRQRKEI